jgi:L-2,4-diaminobutyric acid acetyltransferase
MSVVKNGHLLYGNHLLGWLAMLTRNDSETMEAGHLFLRPPVAEDGPAIHALVARSAPLDLNSPYCYLILCAHFPSTCIVAEENNEIVAFITAYIPPERPDVLFVWQVAVDARMRGRGVAKKMLRHLVASSTKQGVRYVEATVNPSNMASRSLFQSLADASGCTMEESMIFPAEMFGEGDHEQENLIRLGPVG